MLEIGIISVALKAFSIEEFAVGGHSLHTTIPFPSTVYKSSVLTSVNWNKRDYFSYPSEKKVES